MNKNEATDKAQQLKATIEKAQRELKELEEVINKPESGLWRPKKGDTYYTTEIRARSGYRVDELVWEDDAVDIARYYDGECFRTKEEAEEKLVVDMALDRVRKYIIDNGLYSTEGEHAIGISGENLDTYSGYTCYKEILGVFDTEEQARQVIDNCEGDIRTVLSYKGYL